LAQLCDGCLVVLKAQWLLSRKTGDAIFGHVTGNLNLFHQRIHVRGEARLEPVVHILFFGFGMSFGFAQKFVDAR
jgi:hypothetical protein